MGFITEDDYNVLIRTEIKSILLENYTEQKLLSAEEMAISQIKNYLRGYYDVNQIFSAEGNNRSAYMVMITIDCALYHLYTSLAPNKIPQHRTERYADALDWLKSISKGETKADLPEIVDEDGKVKTSIRLTSRYKRQNYKY
ncbi:MAG: DUF1320 family protein [Weeksellaceae bacterium]|nr:DUF1320 family protein [Weeksellaceae bacterium]